MFINYEIGTMARHRAKQTYSKSLAAWIWIPAISLLATSLTYLAPSNASDQGISLYLSAPYVQGSHVTESVLREDFNTLSTDCTTATGVGTVTLSSPHACSLGNANLYGGATVGPENSTPTTGGTGTRFLTNGSNTSLVTFTASTPVKYIGVWWSAGSTGNLIELYSGDTLIQSVTTDVILNLIPKSGGTVATLGGGTHPNNNFYGNPRSSEAAHQPFVYLNLFLSGGLSANRIVISGAGFELDNLVTSTAEQNTTSSMVFVASSQTIAWSPTNTTARVGNSPLTPNNLATVTTPASGGGTITYSVTSQGGSGCTVNSSTGVISYSAAGTCVVRATAAAVNSSPRYFASTKEVSFSIVAAPGTPGTPTAEAGDASANITVVRGSGDAPTSYTVTTAPGGASCTVTPPASSCRITGLTNGTDYTFSSTATNAAGTSGVSVSSSVVRPTAPPANNSSSGSAPLPPQIESISIRPSKASGQSILTVKLPQVQVGQRPTQVEVRILDFQGKLIRKVLVPVDEGAGTLELDVNLAKGTYNTQAIAISSGGSSQPVAASPALVYKPFFQPGKSVTKPVLIGTEVTAAISFLPNSSKLSSSSKSELRELAKTLISTGARVAVTGFSAKWVRGSTSEARIAKARAYKVGKFLRDQGVGNWIYYYGVPSLPTKAPLKEAWKSEIRVLTD